MKYTKMFEPGQIGQLKLRNRIVMAALATGVCDHEQKINENALAYYLERAKGGVGLIIAENTRVNDENGVAAKCQVSVARDEHIAPLKQLADALHAEGAKFFVQLHHPGRETYSNLNGNKPVVSASAVPCKVCQQETRALSTEEVESLVQDFIDGAVRAQKAGVDGVEVHGAHGYMVSQFLSPYTNKRTDKYGGDFEKRFTFLKEIVCGIKEACGSTYPVTVRLTVDELLKEYCQVSEPYFTLDDGVAVCKRLEEIGCDAINVSNGIYESFNALSEPVTYDQGCRTPRIQRVKDAVSIPVIAVDMIKEPAFAEKLLEDGVMDFICLGRALLADPNWANKAKEGRDEEIHRCISCCFCFETLLSQVIPDIGPIKCAVNPRAAREHSYGALNKNGNGRTIAIAGGGVAGLEAAIVLAQRGFHPVVFEQSSVLGGQINVGDKPPKKTKVDWVVIDNKTQCDKLGVEFRMNTEATVETIKALNPYAVIVATGGVPFIPSSITGVPGNNVCTVEAVLTGKVTLSDKKVAVIGSGATGLETTEFLCEKGNHVTIIEMLDAIGKGVYVQTYLDAMDRLSKYEVNHLTGHKLTAVTETGVMLENLAENKLVALDFDYVVLSMGVRPNNALAETCKKHFDRVFVIGDAQKVGRIETAVRDGFEVAYAL